MAACIVEYSLAALGGTNDATNIFTLRIRPTGRGQVSSAGAFKSGEWTSVYVGGQAAARTVTLEQADYYDLWFPEGHKRWNNCLCPSSATADVQDLLSTAS